MGVATGISAGLGIVGGISNMIQGAKEQREAKDALNNYQRQELNNVADGLQVSTLGSDLQREEQARLSSSQIQALQDSGVRGILGGSGRVEAGNQRVMAQTASDLDMQQKQIDQMRAEDEARIRNMQENREQNDINALSSQYQSGKQDQNMGFGNIIQGTGMLGNSFGRNGQFANSQNPYSVSGSPMSNVDTTSQSPIQSRYLPQSGYATPQMSLNPNYGNPNFGPQNAPSWYNNIPNAKYF